MTLEWKPGTGDLRRATLVEQHNPNAEKKAVTYVVGDGAAALSLEVAYGEGQVMQMHLPFAAEDEAIKGGWAPQTCAFVDGAGCYSGAALFSYAVEFFAKHGTPGTVEQPEALWMAMEAHFRETLGTLRQAYGSARRCPTCAGKGVCR